MSRPPADSSYHDNGRTVHIVTAVHRKQIGDHIAVIYVRSDLPYSYPGTNISSQDIEFRVEILDCKVIGFTVGFQVFESVVIEMGESVIWPFADYIQEPACDFGVSYTITMVKKSYGNAKD